MPKKHEYELELPTFRYKNTKEKIGDELYNIETCRAYPPGSLFWKCWSLNGKTHRSDDVPALVTHGLETGAVTDESWYRNGSPHRIGAPATIFRDPKAGWVTLEMWYENGKLHREGGPAIIRRRPETGKFKEKSWWWHGYQHREDGPATIEYNQNGRPVCYHWLIAGREVVKGNFEAEVKSFRRLQRQGRVRWLRSGRSCGY